MITDLLKNFIIMLISVVLGIFMCWVNKGHIDTFIVVLIIYILFKIHVNEGK